MSANPTGTGGTTTAAGVTGRHLGPRLAMTCCSSYACTQTAALLAADTASASGLPLLCLNDSWFGLQRIWVVLTLTAPSVLPFVIPSPHLVTCREQYDRGGGRGRSDRRDYDRRDYDRRGYDRQEYDRRDRSSRDEPQRRRSRSRSRDRSPERSRAGGRDASDVFKERIGGAAATDVRARYGDASGKLDLGPSGSSKRSADEVFLLGGRSYR